MFIHTVMNPESRYSVREARRKGHIVSDSISMTCPEQAGPQRQKADWWSSRAAIRGMRRDATGCGFFFLRGSDENV